MLSEAPHTPTETEGKEVADAVRVSGLPVIQRVSESLLRFPTQVGGAVFFFFFKDFKHV